MSMLLFYIIVLNLSSLGIPANAVQVAVASVSIIFPLFLMQNKVKGLRSQHAEFKMCFNLYFV